MKFYHAEDSKMIESPDGDWVRRHDVCAEMIEILARIHHKVVIEREELRKRVEQRSARRSRRE